MNIFRAFLLCLLVPPSLGQTLDQDEIEEYIMGVNGAMWDELLEYGLSNLPDVDATITYNKTLAGYKLTGKLYLDNGFVMSMSSLLPEKVKHRAGIINDLSFVESELDFRHLKIFREFEYESLIETNIPEKKYGVVFVEPTRYYCSYTVTKNLTNNTVNTEINVGGIQPGFDILRFDPVNELTARLRKIYGSKADVLDGLYELWRPKLQNLLDKVVKRIPFPPLHFESGRRHKQYNEPRIKTPFS